MLKRNVVSDIDTKNSEVYTYLQVVQIANAAAERAVQAMMEQLAVWQSEHLDNGIGQQDHSPDVEIITVDELAALLKISMPSAYSLVNDERFPSFRVGKAIRIDKCRLRKWLSEQCTEQKGAA